MIKTMLNIIATGEMVTPGATFMRRLAGLECAMTALLYSNWNLSLLP